MIAIERLSKRYPGALRPALDNVSLRIEAGSIFGLLGPNGAGKTTLLSVLAGLLPMDAGEIRLDGRPLGAWQGRLGSILGFVPQELAFYPMLSVAENLAFYAGVMGLPRAAARERIAQAMRTVQISELARMRADSLSGGLKRRLNLAIGLLGAPRLLCLDEPTVGIDPHSRHYILERIRALREQGMTIIYTSHYMDEVQQLCDRVAIIEDGRILVQERLQELLQRYADRRLRVRLADGGESLTAQIRAGFPDARWSPAGGELEVTTDQPVAVLSRVESLAGQCGSRVMGFDYGRPRLEDVYLRISGKAWEQQDAAAAERD